MNRDVYIVAGGPSLKGFDFERLRDKDTIVINKSIFDVPDSNYFITVDYTFLQKIDKNHFFSVPACKIFVIDCHYPFMVDQGSRFIDSRTNLVYNLKGFDKRIRSHKPYGIGYSFKDFRTGVNSGYCALQLAVILGYKDIYLLGVDLNTDDSTHYHGGYGEVPKAFDSKLEKYYSYFSTGLSLLSNNSKGIQVFSCSPISRLNDIIIYKNLDSIL